MKKKKNEKKKKKTVRPGGTKWSGRCAEVATTGGLTVRYHAWFAQKTQSKELKPLNPKATKKFSGILNRYFINENQVVVY